MQAAPGGVKHFCVHVQSRARPVQKVPRGYSPSPDLASAFASSKTRLRTAGSVIR